MLPYGNLEVKITATAVRGHLRIERGLTIDADTEQTMLGNLVQRFDQLIKRIVREDEIDRSLVFPQNCSPIPFEAHDSACIVVWPDWYKNATPNAQLTLLVDWRRAVLEQREKASARPKSHGGMTLSALEAKRRSDRERKKRSRERKKNAAITAGTWRPRGRPKKASL